jgi:hypothetical protein
MAPRTQHPENEVTGKELGAITFNGCRRAPPLDSGPLDDELVAESGDEPAVLFAKEEHKTRAR